MNQKRDKVSILHEILVIIRAKEGEAGPTHIMYNANLSHQMLTEYMGDLLTRGLVAENIDRKGKRTYIITDKGHNFMKEYTVIRKFFDSYGLS